MGQAFRGDRAEIMPFIAKTIDSEISGNIIDLCPVGALTSKPFRFSARNWELAQRSSVSPHDGLGSNLVIQAKQQDKVYRVVPAENEAINECWLSDKDRFSYEALNGPDRLAKPMVKQGGQWKEVDWSQALDYVAHALRDVTKTHGAAAIGALVSPHSTLEEMYLAGKLMRGLGSDNIDFRLRQSDFALDGKRVGTPWLGMTIAEVSKLDRALVIGSFLRKDHPLLAQRLRQSAKRGTQVSVLHAAGDDQLVKLFAKLVTVPSQLPNALAQVVKAAAEAKGLAPEPLVAGVTVGEEAKKIAQSLVTGRNAAVLLGNFAQQHAQASTLQLLAQLLCQVTGAKFGFLGEAANSVGGYVAKALPANGLNAAAMIADPRKAYLVVGAEPELDCADGRAALAAMKQAETVIVMSPFKSAAALEYADAILPVAPFTETSGSFVNTEGRVQSFAAAVRPLGETRPAWKVLRVLGNLLKIDGFDFESSEDVRAEALGGKPEFVSGLNNSASGVAALGMPAAAFERVADVPIHFADPLVRRSPSLQKTKDSVAPTARMNAATLAKAGVAAGDRVRVRMGEGSAELVAQLDAALADGAVRVAAAHAATAGLGTLSGALTVEKA
jgi:NADH-quinone oxidoreductase subunit G